MLLRCSMGDLSISVPYLIIAVLLTLQEFLDFSSQNHVRMARHVACIEPAIYEVSVKLSYVKGSRLTSTPREASSHTAQDPS